MFVYRLWFFFYISLWQNGFLNSCFVKGYSLLVKIDTLYFQKVYLCKVLLLKFVVTVICYQRAKNLWNKKDRSKAFRKRIENTHLLKNQWSHMKLKVIQVLKWNYNIKHCIRVISLIKFCCYRIVRYLSWKLLTITAYYVCIIWKFKQINLKSWTNYMHISILEVTLPC